MTALVGRDAEQSQIEGLITRARDGLAGVLVLRGEAGIGKTCLLDALAASAPDFEVVRVVGIESEMRLGFAGLHQLLRPYLRELDSLPSPQARALKAAFGMSDEAAPDQFFAGLAALTLISTAATRRPLLVVIDDAQWLDPDSAGALGILARRLQADRVCLLASMREPFDDGRHFDGLPTLTLNPLGGSASIALLESAVTGPVADDVRERVLADARGNPLALIEFGRELSPEQLEGSAQLPPALPVDRELEGLFLRQLDALPPATQRLLLAAAAEPTGDSAAVLRAGAELDFDDSAVAPAQRAGLLERGPALRFRHPLVRAAVYQGATVTDRCRTHAALAAVTDATRDPETRAWHRASATQFPDDDVATELETATQQAGARGSCAASAALLARAAELTLDNQQRAARLFGAAVADLTAGNTTRARAILTRAKPDLHHPLLAASAQRLEGAIAFVDSDGGDRQAVSLMVDAAQSLASLDMHMARDAMFDTLPMAIYFGNSSPVPVVEVAQLARAFQLPEGTAPTSADLVLDAIATLFTEDYATSIPAARDALTTVLADVELLNTPRHVARTCYLAHALSDDDAHRTLATACATASREQGSFQGLIEALSYLFLIELRVGTLEAAADHVAEERALQTMAHHPTSRGTDARDVMVAAWRGREADVRATVADLEARASELGYVMRLNDHAQVVLELGLGNYQAAASLSRADWLHDLALGGLRAADDVEAHVRCGNRDGAHTAAEHLRERAAATDAELDRGLLSRAEALLAEDSDAEAHFQASISTLGDCGARLHAARSKLLYGEWLRRQKRRRDARQHLEAALDAFESMGAAAFAERARVELLATGATARKRVDETRQELTPQESQIARLAASGLTNAEVAERLYISASTVDYHLRKIFRKLDLRSRHELASAMASN